ncbi:MAG: sulfatase-like hydrolase/transferase [Myxococcales bacterium]|nr:sulfatase-like hydrolase/transferase [Myxococcales bacterium]
MGVLVSLSLAGVLPAGCGERPKDSTSRPNVLIVMVDDLASGAVGAFGGDPQFTPHIDRLAAESVLFENAVVATPLCTPSRNAFLTGRWPHAIGVTQLDSQLPLGTPTLGTLFQAAGYATAAIGKMHWYRGRLGSETFGFERFVDRKDWEEGLSEEERAIWNARKTSWSQRATSFEARFNPAGEPLAIAPERQLAAFIVNETLRFIDDAKGRPFLAISSFYEPHAPFTFPESFAGRALPEDIKPPSFDVAAARASVPGLTADYWKHAARYGPLSEDRIRGMTAAYLQSVAWVDDRIGELLAGLEERGLTDETVIVFWSDHGLLLGEHGLTGKSLPFHEALRAPLLVRAPGWKPRREAGLAHALDVFPTLCELAAIDPPSSLAGGSLTSTLPRDSVFSEQIGRWAAVRTERWKLVLGTSRENGWDQLYDLVADPNENENLIADPVNAPIVADLTQRIHKVFVGSPPDWLPVDEWMVQADTESAVRWAIAQIEPEGRRDAVRRRRAARKGAREED